MHVDAPCLTVMDLTTNHRWICVCLHLKAGYAVPMDVTALKVTLKMNREIQLLYVLSKYSSVHEQQLENK